MNGAVNAPRIISWNITLRPPLKCSHCYVDAGEDETDGVLSTHEAFSVIDQVRAIGTPVVILSGGEPLLREDVYAIARYGTEQGLRMIMEYFAANPKVSVEIEEYAPDLSVFSFVSLQGTPEEVKDPAGKKKARQQFVEMVTQKKLSPHVLTTLGHRPSDRPDVLVNKERSMVRKLVGVKDIVALKNG